MVTQFQHFNIISYFEIKYKFKRFTQEAENMKSHLCAQHLPGPNTAIPHKIWGARELI